LESKKNHNNLLQEDLPRTRGSKRIEKRRRDVEATDTMTVVSKVSKIRKLLTRKSKSKKKTIKITKITVGVRRSQRILERS